MTSPIFYCSAVAAVLAIGAFTGCSQSANTTAQNSSAPGAPAATQHVRGVIQKVSADSLTVTTAQGPVVVSITPTTKVAGVVPGTRADIKENTFIGAANAPQNGSTRALEVVVFPDSMRGTGEGNYAWDLPADGGGSGSMMTNGTVSHGSMMTNGTVSHGSMMTNGTVSHGSMMTNGTVAGASSKGPLSITVAYKGGSTTMMIPEGTPIVRIAPASRDALMQGAHVFVVATGATDHPVAARIIVGEHGTVPPM